MKAAVIFSAVHWAAVCAGGFWGWLTSCAAGAVALWYVTRREA